MSTAGKVLTILVLLMMFVWIVMLSAVDQRNINHEMKIAQQQKELDKLTEDTAKAASTALTLTEEARVVQDSTARDIRALDSRIAAAERKLSDTVEKQSRVKAQLNDAVAAAETSKTNLTHREAEKVKLTDDLAKKRDEIAKAQATNGELRAQLAQLQDEFKRLLAENSSEVSKAMSKPPATPASSRREPPAS